MAASSSATFFFGLREEEEDQDNTRQPVLPAPTAPLPAEATGRRRRKIRSDTDVEVIALSPTTLMATHRFICEVCSKGFQREQNLQLHRRGHNLPWKLRHDHKPDKAAAKPKVYVCPETTCVHHHPSKALGDLTGIKKHYFRKHHGERKYKCDKCSRKYAVQSDWKAHKKVCGSKEYRCDCGSLFSRRDSFITHRAFCDALAQEAARHPHPHHHHDHDQILTVDHNTVPLTLSEIAAAGDQNPTHHHHHHETLCLGSTSQLFPPEFTQNHPDQEQDQTENGFFLAPNKPYHEPLFEIPDLLSNPNPNANPSSSNNLSSSSGLFFLTNNQNFPSYYGSSSGDGVTDPSLSATALLQKAARVGSSSSNSLINVVNSSHAGGGGGFGCGGGFSGLSINNGGHFQGEMGSLGGGSNYMFGGRGGGGGGGGGGFRPYGVGGDEDDENDYGSYNPNKIIFEKPLLDHSTNFVSDDRMTRDFLGVGEIERNAEIAGMEEKRGMDHFRPSDSQRNFHFRPSDSQRNFH